MVFGFVIWGSEHLPEDLPLDLNEIRRWAIESGLVFDEGQLLTGERVEKLKTVFTEEELRVAIIIERNKEGLMYLEQPYVPLSALVKRGVLVELVWWRLMPKSWDSSGVREYGTVRFGFWLPREVGGEAFAEEFVSESAAKNVVEKFAALTKSLVNELPPDFVKRLSDGSIDVTVDGAVRARFFKAGRRFDVEFLRHG